MPAHHLNPGSIETLKVQKNQGIFSTLPLTFFAGLIQEATWLGLRAFDGQL